MGKNPNPLIMNSIAVIIVKNNTIPYSATKITANVPLPYSTLNPDTNSLSPSLKSIGARLVSAIQDTAQIIKTGKER